MTQYNETEMVEHTPLDERDVTAKAAIDAMQQEEQVVAEEESTDDTQDTDEADTLDADMSRQMLAYGLGVIEFSVGAVCDVPFEIEEQAGNKWLDAATPMLQKYGPAGLAWFEKYQHELMFTMASCSLVGGCTLQVRR